LFRCGWVRRYAACPVDANEEVFFWQRWEPRECSKNKETGEPRYQMEFVPVPGPRSEFMSVFQSGFER
jgi:hypothetical protein